MTIHRVLLGVLAAVVVSCGPLDASDDMNDGVVDDEETEVLKSTLRNAGYRDVAREYTPVIATRHAREMCDSFAAAGYDYKDWLDQATIAVMDEGVDPELFGLVAGSLAAASCNDDYHRMVDDR